VQLPPFPGGTVQVFGLLLEDRRHRTMRLGKRNLGPKSIQITPARRQTWKSSRVPLKLGLHVERLHLGAFSGLGSDCYGEELAEFSIRANFSVISYKAESKSNKSKDHGTPGVVLLSVFS
jgi:hypothetical protein